MFVCKFYRYNLTELDNAYAASIHSEQHVSNSHTTAQSTTRVSSKSEGSAATAHICSGTFPVNWLLPSCTSTKVVIWPSWVGIGPVRAFSFSKRLSSTVSWPSSVGITPDNGALRPKFKYFKFVSDPNSNGIVPENKQARALNRSNFVSNPSSGGRGPKSNVESNAMSLRVNMVKSSSGIAPLSALFPDK